MKRTKKFKIVSLLIVCIIMATALAACSEQNGGNTSNATNEQDNGNETSGNEEKLTGAIEVGTLLPDPDAIELAVAEDIKQDNPDTRIDFVFANTDARPAIDQRWRAGDPPTIDINIFNGLIPKTHDFVKQDQLLDLTPYMQEQAADQDMSWGETFLPTVKQMLTLDDKYYSVPINVSIFGLYYNKKMFDDLGINPPETWDEFIQVCETLKENDIDPVAVTGQFNPYMQMWTDYLMQREVGYDETVQAVRGGGFKDNPGFLEAAKKLENMANNGYFLEGFESTDFMVAQMAFVQEKAGMILMGSWLSSEMKDSMPEDFQMGMVPFPTVDGGEGDQATVFGSAIMMSVAKADENKDLAVEYLKQYTSKATQTRMVQENNVISSVQNVEISDEVIGLEETLESGDMVMRYLGIENDAELYNAYGLEVSKLFFGKSTAEQFIDAIDAVAKKYAE